MSNLPTVKIEEEDFIIEATRRDTEGSGKILSFVKGDYFCDKNLVPLHTRFKIYRHGWVKVWINFNTSPITRYSYRVSRGEIQPERDTLGDNDKTKWKIGMSGVPEDPWVKQYMVPFEFVETGERVRFRTNTWGGRTAVSELLETAAYRAKLGEPCVPIIAISSAIFGKNKVKRPQFDIVGWEDDLGVRPEIAVLDDDDREPPPVEYDSIPF